MHALLRRLALPLTGFAALSLLTLSAGARTVTDDNGASVEVPDKVERVAVTNIFPLAAAVTAYTQSGETVIGMEGQDTGEWVLVDCGSVVCHCLQPAVRDYYNLEEIWGGKEVFLEAREKLDDRLMPHRQKAE